MKIQQHFRLFFKKFLFADHAINAYYDRLQEIKCSEACTITPEVPDDLLCKLKCFKLLPNEATTEEPIWDYWNHYQSNKCVTTTCRGTDNDLLCALKCFNMVILPDNTDDTEMNTTTEIHTIEIPTTVVPTEIPTDIPTTEIPIEIPTTEILTTVIPTEVPTKSSTSTVIPTTDSLI